MKIEIFSKVKIFTIFSRILMQFYLYYQIENQTTNFLTFCSAPLAPVNQNFLLRLFLISFLPHIGRFFTKHFQNNHDIRPLLKLCSKLSIRVLLLLIIKIITFGNYEMMTFWFKMQSLFFELLILLLSVGLDCFNFYATEIAEFLFIDFFLMGIYIFELTRTFCFKFGFFFFGFNLIIICISIVEGYRFRAKRINSIFTKQDGYRILVFSIIYFMIFAFTSLRYFPFKYFLKTMIALPLLILSVKYFKKSQYQKSLNYIITFQIIIILLNYLQNL